MARSWFAGTGNELPAVLGPEGELMVRPLWPLKIWDSETGGTQYTGLLLNGVSVDVIPPRSTGYARFQGPDGINIPVWGEINGGTRFIIMPQDTGGGGGGGGWTAVDASEIVKGIAELATQAETNTGTDDARIVTPLKFATRMAAYAQPLDSDLTAIAALTTTSYGRALLALADQAALMALLLSATTSTQGIVELATTGEATTGTDTTRAVTPAGLAAAIAAAGGGGGGGATTLDGLSDVVVASHASGRILQADGTNFVDVDGSTVFQPLDSDLTAIAALTTTSYGRAFLALANQAALMGLLSASSETAQGIIEIATQTETNTGTDDARAVTPLKLQTRMAAYAQPLDTDLTAIAALTSAANKLPYATGAGTWTLADLTAAGRALLDDADASAQLTTLGISTFVKTLLDDVDAATARGTLGLATVASSGSASDLGTGTLPNARLDAELQAIAGLTSAADQVPYFTGSGAAALLTITSAARTVLDDTTVAAMLATLGGAPLPSLTSNAYTAAPAPAMGPPEVRYVQTGMTGAVAWANPTGTAAHGDRLKIRFKDNGTARAQTWGTKYRDLLGYGLPTTSVISKWTLCDFEYNATDDKFDLVAKGVQA